MASLSDRQTQTGDLLAGNAAFALRSQDGSLGLGCHKLTGKGHSARLSAWDSGLGETGTVIFFCK